MKLWQRILLYCIPILMGAVLVAITRMEQFAGKLPSFLDEIGWILLLIGITKIIRGLAFGREKEEQS